MTSMRRKKGALVSSVISILLCISMLLGTTMAWFTDTTSNTGNRIQTGGMDVKLLRYNGTKEYEDISGDVGGIFTTENGVRWEPGKTELVYLAVENQGSLALDYNIALEVRNSDGERGIALENVLSYVLIPGPKMDPESGLPVYANWDEVVSAAKSAGGGSPAWVPTGKKTISEGGDLVAQEADYFALAVHMDEKAGNIYQGQAIEVDVKVMAKQMDYESDSFGSEYDEDALFTEKEEAVYLNRTFDEEGVDGLDKIEPFVASPNIISVKEEKSGNKYISLERNAADVAALFQAPSVNGSFISKEAASSKMIVEFDIASTKPGNLWMALYDHATGYFVIGTTDSAGKLKFDNKELATLGANYWVNIAYLFDFDAKKVDIYVDGKLTVDDLSVTSIQSISRMRVQINGTGSNDIMLDNIKIYEGTEVRDLPEQGRVFLPSDNTMPTYKDAIAKLAGTTALHVNGGWLFANGQKTEITVPGQMESDANGDLVASSILVPKSVVSDGLGLAVEYDGGTAVTVGSGIVMTVDSKEVTTAEGSVILDTAPAVVNGELLLPLYELATKVLDKKALWDDHGFMIISDTEMSLSENEVFSVNSYLLYDHPTKEEILEMFAETSEGVHPRIMATEDTFKRMVDAYNAGGTMKEWGDEVIFKADFYLKQPLPSMPGADSFIGEQALLVIPQGIKGRIEDLAVAYKLTGDTKYADRVYAELENAANFSDWNTRHFLNAAEYMTAFAIGYDWLYDYYTPSQRKMIEDAIYEKGLLYAQPAYYDTMGANGSYFWATTYSNWNIVCNGGSILGAVAVLDKYPDVAADIISSALRGMDYSLINYYPDGAWSEGLGYWEFATEFLMRASTTLTACFGQDFNITNATGFTTTTDQPIHLNGYAASNNYHDCGAALFESTNLFWLADKFDDPGVAQVQYEVMKREGIGITGLDMLYCNVDQLEGESTFPTDKYIRGNELVAMRTSWDDARGTYLSFHGGEAYDGGHGHVDSGAFVIDMLGERIAIDPGADIYDHPDYFATTRYNMYRARAEGHNMVVLNPDEGAGLSDSFAKVEKFESNAKGVYSVLDLSEAYREDASSYKRGYKLEDDRRGAVVRDEFTLKDDSTGYWFMHTFADVEIKDQNTAILTQNNKKFLVRIATSLDSDDYTFSLMDAKPLIALPLQKPEIDNTAEGMKKLAIKFSGDAGDNVYIEMKMIPYEDPARDVPLTNFPIAQWTLPEGELSTLPKADMIYANGEKIVSFDPEELSYTVNVPTGEGVPTITADVAADVEYSVISAENLSGTTVVKVTDKNNNLYSYYYVKFREVNLNVAQIVPGATRHEVKNILACDNPQPANMDVNILDGNYDTRWSVEGFGSWVILDLGTAQKIDAFGLATYLGHTRTLSYSIDISDDGTNWENIHIGLTTLTTDLEIIKVSDICDKDEVSARYVRLNAYGTSTGTWNSITEFATLDYN